jgi:hypothetical protein
MDIPIRPYKIEIQIMTGDESAVIPLKRFGNFYFKRSSNYYYGLVFAADFLPSIKFSDADEF